MLRESEQLRRFQPSIRERPRSDVIRLIRIFEREAGLPEEMRALESTVLETFKGQAEAGDALSQLAVAACYMEGSGGAIKDARVGLEWLRKAAEQGLPAVQFGLIHGIRDHHLELCLCVLSTRGF